MSATEVIEPAQTSWALPIVFMQKKDNMLRSCFDYRELKAVKILGYRTRTHTAHGQAYRLARGHNGILGFWRKADIGRSQSPSRKVIKWQSFLNTVPPFYTNSILAEERPRDASTLDWRPDG